MQNLNVENFVSEELNQTEANLHARRNTHCNKSVEVQRCKLLKLECKQPLLGVIPNLDNRVTAVETRLSRLENLPDAATPGTQEQVAIVAEPNTGIHKLHHEACSRNRVEAPLVSTELKLECMGSKAFGRRFFCLFYEFTEATHAKLFLIRTSLRLAVSLALYERVCRTLCTVQNRQNIS